LKIGSGNIPIKWNLILTWRKFRAWQNGLLKEARSREVEKQEVKK
jgi:hypothetical protein